MATEVTIPQQQTDGGSAACLMTNLGWMLDHASHAFGSEVAAALAPLGLGQRGFCVLSAAVDAEYTQTQLAGMIGLDKTTMVVTVDELERLGLAERVPSPTDRRARVIKVTGAGRERLVEGQDIIQRVQTDVLESLPDGEREAFVSCLAQLVTGRLASPAECHPPLRRREPRV
jgi:MarR family transcriptional regulator, transcriptional regulator for hemolysin